MREDADFCPAAFTPLEIAECDTARDAAREYAARFAAKEATLKSLGLRPPDTGVFREIEVRAAGGTPAIAFHGRLGARLAKSADLHTHLALAHTTDHAIAIVFTERTHPAA